LQNINDADILFTAEICNTHVSRETCLNPLSITREQFTKQNKTKNKHTNIQKHAKLSGACFY